MKILAMPRSARAAMFALLFCIAVAGCSRTINQGTCKVINGVFTKQDARKMYEKYRSPVIVYEGGTAVVCDCGARQHAGAAESRTIDGSSQQRNFGGGTESRSLTGNVESRRIGGDTEARKLSGKSEERNFNGGLQDRDMKGGVESRRLSGKTEARHLGGDSDELICLEVPKCNGFILKKQTVAKGFVYNSSGYQAAAECIEW